MLFRNTLKYLPPLITALITALTTAMLAASCIRDNREDCLYPVSLKLLFTHNVEGKDLFETEGINNIHLFVYDYQNRLTLQQQLHHSDLTPENTCRLMLPMGRYTLIVWAGELQGDTYRYESEEYLPKALLKLQREPGGIAAQPPGKLFHGICIPVLAGIVGKDTYEADLSKNTNDVRITIKEKNAYVPRPKDFGCTISAVNGDYTFDNRTHGTDRVHYTPRTAGTNKAGTNEADKSTAATGTTVTGSGSSEVHCDFTVLRLWDGDDSRLTLTCRNASGGTRTESIIYDGSLSKLLLKKPGTDLELEDHFELVFTVDPQDPTDVTLTVNGWAVVDHNSGL